ncbi:MAG TPA: AMP-binding protein [Burkholderiaceae bacterium]|nr:AMP-binding protein [Burkholderiaceae bacterium]
MSDQYRALYEGFRWHVPRRFNIADACAGRWSRSDRIAILYESDDGARSAITYRQLHRDANRLANALAALGVSGGDRIAIVIAQRPETAIAHLACYRLGAVAMPMSVLFGPDALSYRFANSDAHHAIVDASVLDAVTQARVDSLRSVIVVGEPSRALDEAAGERRFDALLEAAADRFTATRTLATDPADLIYTSGTTGPPKGALIPHSALIGNLPGFVASQNWFPQPNDVFWSPADWAWTGGLMDALLPSLYFGMPIVAWRGRFSADKAYELLERHRVTNAFLFPTALKMMMKALPEPRRRHALHLRAIMSAGESVGQTVFDWCRDALGLTVNEMFGQTEVNYIVGNSALRWPARAGSIGRPYPGHRVAVLADDGSEAAPGTLGEVAVHRRDIHGDPDPVFFLGYWRNPEATERKFAGDWCMTGDLATRDADGYLWYGGRADDMFKAAGYRIGPGEIENCLLQHPAVANAAVVPKPDPERGHVVKAYVVLASGARGDDALVESLQQHVRGRLAPYEYPKEIEFIEALPMTTTGKVQRAVLRQRERERVGER